MAYLGFRTAQLLGGESRGYLDVYGSGVVHYAISAKIAFKNYIRDLSNSPLHITNQHLTDLNRRLNHTGVGSNASINHSRSILHIHKIERGLPLELTGKGFHHPNEMTMSA